MAKKSRLELQIEAAFEKIKNEQKRLKELQNAQSEKERKARNHRLCKRHGYLESVLPDSIKLTDEQFQEFVKQYIGNKYGLQAIANFVAENEKIAAANATEEAEETPAATVPEPAGAEQNNDGDNASAKSEQVTESVTPQPVNPTGTHQNQNGNSHTGKKHNGGHNNPHKSQHHANGNSQTVGATA